MKKKPVKKTNLLAELTNRKMEALKSGETPGTFSNFRPNKKIRTINTSNVGPSWGPRKGN